MLPHQKFFKENISEYIIHLYKTEELIRSFEFNLDEINQHVIRNIETDESTRKQILLWYAKIISDMTEQGLIENKGHLKETIQYAEVLQQLHLDLLKSDSVYPEIFEQAKPIIDEHINLSGNSIKDVVQVCLNSVYGLLLLRVQGKKVDDELMQKIELQADVLSYLSKVYNLQRKDL